MTKLPQLPKVCSLLYSFLPACSIKSTLVTFWHPLFSTILFFVTHLAMLSPLSYQFLGRLSSRLNLTNIFALQFCQLLFSNCFLLLFFSFFISPSPPSTSNYSQIFVTLNFLNFVILVELLIQFLCARLQSGWKLYFCQGKIWGLSHIYKTLYHNASNGSLNTSLEYFFAPQYFRPYTAMILSAK